MNARGGLCAALIVLGLVLATNLANAARGVDLRWNACFGDGGQAVRGFACDRNTGVDVLVGSFEVGEAMPAVTGLEIVIDVQSDSAVLPAWWEFRNVGSCRTNALSFTTTAPADAALCLDWAQGQAMGAIGRYMIGLKGPHTSRIVAASAVQASAAASLIPEQEYFAFTVSIQHTKTVGTGACEGCCTPTMILFNRVVVTTPVLADNRFYTGATNGTDSDFAFWQRGFLFFSPSGSYMTAPPPCGPVPTRARTWSELKALYR